MKISIMKSMGTLAVATLVVALSSSTRAEETEQGKQAATAMEQLAASMKPGDWRKLSTKGYDRELLRVGNHHILQYTHDATWDEQSRQIFFVGQGHYSDLKFIAYSAGTNAWQQLPTPWWKRDPAKGRGPIGHAYDNNALLDSFFYHQQYGQGTALHRYDIARKEWSDLPAAPAGLTGRGHSCALEPFPELGGIVKVCGENVGLLDTNKNQWKLLGKVQGLNIHPFAEYNPVRQVVIFGGGNDSQVLYKLDPQGKITKLKDVPLSSINSTHRFVVTTDPVSGDYLVVQNGDQRRNLESVFYAYDIEQDKWRKLPGVPHGGIAAPVPNYGVIVFCTYRPAEVWLYKHAENKQGKRSAGQPK